MATIHNEKNFKPEDYRVYDYFDNKPPQPYFREPAESYTIRFNEWKKEANRCFPKSNFHRCEHCGQSNVRYVVAVDHIPSGERVCFGDVCVDRLGFPNHDAFKSALIRKRAQAEAASIRISEKIHATLAEDSELKTAIDSILENRGENIHSRNTFAHDIVRKFRHYGDISERQRETLISSIERDKEWDAKKKAQPKAGKVPTGRIEIEGEVISTKVQDTPFGTQYKMLVKLENGSKVWGTIPSAIEPETSKGAKVRFTAKIEASKDDPSFGFYSRPSKATLLN